MISGPPRRCGLYALLFGGLVVACSLDERSPGVSSGDSLAAGGSGGAVAADAAAPGDSTPAPNAAGQGSSAPVENPETPPIARAAGQAPDGPVLACQPSMTSTCGSIYNALGVCAALPLTCSTSGAWPPMSTCAPTSAEVCDAAKLDENCDGRSNEGCACSPGDTSPCSNVYGSLGECAPRLLACTANGSWPAADACAPQSAEVCAKDGKDENCDGHVNEPPCDVFVDIAIGTNGFSCAVSSSGKVLCWGANDQGQLGDGTRTARALPTEVPGITTARRIDIGLANACALLADGTVRCWGQNFIGTLGDGTTNNSTTPVEVLTAASTPLTGVKALSMGRETCGLLMSGDVYCWGSIRDISTPDPFAVPIPGATGVVSIADDPGAEATCAVLTNGGMRCWGYNFFGENGDGTTNASFGMPVAVQNIPPVKQAFLIEDETCALTVAGDVYCWGSGRLGDGMTTNSSFPVKVPSLSNVKALMGGNLTVCALLADNSVKCWGSGAVASDVPAPVPGLALLEAAGIHVVQMESGFSHSCVRADDLATYCWGEPYFNSSVLGNDVTTTSDTATRVFGP